MFYILTVAAAIRLYKFVKIYRTVHTNRLILLDVSYTSINLK